MKAWLESRCVSDELLSLPKILSSHEVLESTKASSELPKKAELVWKFWWYTSARQLVGGTTAAQGTVVFTVALPSVRTLKGVASMLSSHSTTPRAPHENFRIVVADAASIHPRNRLVGSLVLERAVPRYGAAGPVRETSTAVVPALSKTYTA